MAHQRQTVPMRTQAPQMKMERYFYPVEIPGYVRNMAIVGSLLLILGVVLWVKIGFILFSQVVIVLGLLLLLGGVIPIVLISRSNPSDQQYDQWLDWQARRMQSKAIRTLGLDERQISGILCIPSFVLPGSRPATNYRSNEVQIKQGKDGKWRCSVNVYTYIFSTDHSIALFTSDINVFNLSPFIWQNEEFPYRHIVSATIKTLRDTTYVEREEHWYRVKQICLKISNSETIPLGAYHSATPIDESEGAPDFTVLDEYIHQYLNNLRGLLHIRRR